MANKKIAETAQSDIQNLDDAENIGIPESERRPGRVRQSFAERFRNFLVQPQRRTANSRFGVSELGVEQLEEVCAPAVVPAWPTSGAPSGWQGQILKTAGNGTMYDSVVSTSGNYVVMAYQNGTVEIRSAITGAITKSINTGIGRAYFLAADPIRERVYVSSGTGSTSQLQGYDLATGNRVLTINTGKWTNKPNLSDDGSKIEIDLDNDEGTGSAVFDANTGAQISTMPPFSMMGTFIGNDTLLSWRWDTRQLLKQDGTGTHVLTTTAPLIYDIPVSPDKTKIALVDRNGTAKIADATTGATIKSFTIETGVESARFLSNTFVVIGLGGGRVDVFDISGNTPVRTQILNAGGQTVMNIQTIGQYLVADAGDRLVTRLQTEILLPPPPPNPIIETINTLPPLVIPTVPQQQKDLAPWLSQQSAVLTARGEQLQNLQSQLDIAIAEQTITTTNSALLQAKMQTYSGDLLIKFGIWQNTKDTLSDGLAAIVNSAPSSVDPATLTTQNIDLISGTSSRMFVSFPTAPNDQSSTLNIRFRSPYDRTYIEVIDESGQMNHMYMVGDHNEFRQTVEHTGGTTDQTVSFGFLRANSGNGGNVTVRMYRDATKSTMLGEIHGGYFPGVNTGWLEAQPSWASLGGSANFELTELGGHAEMKGWRDRDNHAPELYNLCVAQGYTTMQSKGAITSLDLSNAQHLVTGVSFKAKGGTDSSQLQVTFLRGSTVLSEQTVAGNTTVGLSDLEGITSVLIRDLSVPLGETGSVTLKELSVTGSPEHDQVGAEQLSSATNAAISKSSAQRMDTTSLPSNYPAPPVPYDPNSYNVYKLRKYGASPAIEYIGYKAPNGVFSQLDHGTYEVHGDTWIIYPTGQNLQLGMYTQGGTAYRTDLAVGQNFDFEVIHSTSPTLAEALHSEDTSVEIPEIKLMTINQGDTPGWHSGKKLETDNGSPVAIGTIKARAQVTNNGVLPISFTVNVYSGYSSTAGWDTPIATYPGSLGPNESRTLTVPVDMRADSQGRGLVRFVITDSTGKILTQMERTVGAPNNTEKRVATQLANGLWTLAWVPKTSSTPTLSFTTLNQQFIQWKQQQITEGRTWVADPAQYDQAKAQFDVEVARNPSPEQAAAAQEQLDSMASDLDDKLNYALTGGLSPEELTFGETIKTYIRQNQTSLQTNIRTAFILGGKTVQDADHFLQGITLNPLSLDMYKGENQAIQPTQLIASAQSDILSGVFGIPTVQAASFEQSPNMFIRTQEWFTGALAGLPFGLRTDTAAGRMFAGILTQASQFPDLVHGRYTLAHPVENVGKIPSGRIMNALRSNNAATRANNLKAVFTEHGYGYLFESTPAATPQVYARTVGTQFNDFSQNVPVRFDFTTTDGTYDHALAYIGDANGIQIDPMKPVTGTIHGGLSTSIPMTAFQEQFTQAGTQQFTVVVVLWDDNGTIIKKASNVITVTSGGLTQYNAETAIGTSWASLTDMQKTTLTKALNFGNLNGLPMNKQLIDYFVSNYIFDTQPDITNANDLAFDPSALMWTGATGLGDTCKIWITNLLHAVYAQNGGSINVPVNGMIAKDTQGNILYEADGTTPKKDNSRWNMAGSDGKISEILHVIKTNIVPVDTVAGENTYVDGAAVKSGDKLVTLINMKSRLEAVQAKPGDIIQMTGTFDLHTMMIGAIQENGIWVADSNWSPSQDGAVRYRFVDYSKLNSTVNKFSLYRFL